MSNQDCMILEGDARKLAKTLPKNSVNSIVTSPPYWGLRDYGHGQQMGQEKTLAEYVNGLTGLFSDLRPALTDDGTIWLNLGDSYTSGFSGQYGKNLMGIPWRVALALQDDGWVLRSDIIWHKPNGMPESVKDRPTRNHEYIFLLSKSPTYYYNHEAIKEPAKLASIERARRDVSDAHKNTNGVPGQTPHILSKPRARYSFKRAASQRGQSLVPGSPPTHRPSREGIEYNSLTVNKRTVWTVATKTYSGAHFAVFPPELITPCILAGCPPGGLVLDPFFGSGTVGLVASQHNRRWLGFELNPEYIELAKQRLAYIQPAFPDILEGVGQRS